MNPDLYYKKLGVSNIFQEYFEKNFSTLEFVESYGWDLAFLPTEVILSDPLLSKINEVCKIQAACYLKLDSYRCYVWHDDEFRGVTINMLVTPNSNSMMLFGKDIEGYGQDQKEIIELKYEPNTLYLVNVQEQHTVINFENTRYMFSVVFEKDKNELSYNDCLSAIQQMNNGSIA